MGRFDRDALAHLSRQGYAETLAYIHCAIACLLSSSICSASSIYAGGSSDSVFDGIFAGKLRVPCSSHVSHVSVFYSVRMLLGLAVVGGCWIACVSHGSFRN